MKVDVIVCVGTSRPPNFKGSTQLCSESKPHYHLPSSKVSSTLSLPLHLSQIATDCNENIRKAENEMKLLAITKRFPSDEVDIVSARYVMSGKGVHSQHESCAC